MKAKKTLIQIEMLAAVFGLAVVLAGCCSTPTVEKVAARAVLDLPSGPGNSRNSEGDFMVLKDGRILFIYSKFIGGNGADGDQCVLAARESADKGETWSGDRVVTTNELEPGGNVMSVSMLRLKDGRIALFYISKLSIGNGIIRNAIHLRTSADEGKTWSAAREVTANIKKSYYCLNNSRIERLKSGRILIPLADHGEFSAHKFQEHGPVSCLYSDDDGETWRQSAILDRDEEGRKRKLAFQEPGVIELKDGRLLMYIRTNAGYQYYSYSSDEGATWSAAKPSPLCSPQSPAEVVRLNDGRLMVVWNNHEGRPDLQKAGHAWSHGVRTPLTIAFSTDEGKTWTDTRNLEDGFDPNDTYRFWYCYPAILELDDRLILAYCAENNLRQLRITIIPKPIGTR